MSTTTEISNVTQKYKSLLIQKMPQLRVLPAVAIEALDLLRQPECSVIEISAIVERDVTLASSMLRIANSPIYSPKRTISSLRNAVVRLGFHECRNLIMSSCVSTLTKKLSFEEEWVRDLLWRHSLYTAAIAYHVNRVFRCGFQGEEFTAGLLHDIGRFLFSSLFPQDFMHIDPLDFCETPDPTVHERNQLGISHVEFGEFFAELNRLPDSLRAVIRWHHAPENCREHQKLVTLIAVADHMANHLQRVGDAEGYDSESNPALELFNASGMSRGSKRFVDFAESLMMEAADDMHAANAL